MLDAVNPAAAGGGIAIALFFGILAAIVAGRWIGRRAIAHYGSARAPSVGSMEAAVFALMGLLIAFTFSGALDRFDKRRAQIVEEANAVGTAWLRLDLLPAPAQPDIRQSFRDYVDSRIATYRRLPDLKAAQAEVEHPWVKHKERPLVVAAGRLHFVKGFDDLLEAFAKLRETLDARLLILGEGKERERLEAQVHRLGLDESVQLPGRVGSIAPWLARADL